MLVVAVRCAAEQGMTRSHDLQELTAAQRKRLKKKAKAKGGKAEAADEEPAEDTSSKKAGAKKAGGKPVSAAVRKMQEQVEARRAAEEAARLAEEERIRKVGLMLLDGMFCWILALAESAGCDVACAAGSRSMAGCFACGVRTCVHCAAGGGQGVRHLKEG